MILFRRIQYNPPTDFHEINPVIQSSCFFYCFQKLSRIESCCISLFSFLLINLFLLFFFQVRFRKKNKIIKIVFIIVITLFRVFFLLFSFDQKHTHAHGEKYVLKGHWQKRKKEARKLDHYVYGVLIETRWAKERTRKKTNKVG